MKNKVLTVVFGIAVAVLILAFSIGLPIYVRPFYYLQIDALDIPERSGFDYETIKEAYDEMLDFCTIPWAEFGTGDLLYSESGESHFTDCKWLFLLDGAALLISLIAVVVLLILNRCGVFDFVKPFGFDATFFSATGLLSVFAVLTIVVSLDFNTAFKVFHALFFPGKDNWMFNPRTDQIILVLPQEFFMNCAILIVSSIILISLFFIIKGIIKRKIDTKK